MTVLFVVEKLDAITRLHGEIQGILGDRLKVKMHVTDFPEDHPGEKVVGVLFTSDTGVDPGAGSPTAPESGRLPPGEPEAGRAEGSPVLLVGKHRDFQQFLNKEGPSYDEEFMLDLEFDFGAGTCSVHHINLPGPLRGKNLGTAIIERAEYLARQLGMKNIYVPSEHRATAFWLKIGYLFSIPGEKDFYNRNKARSNLYVAYDLRKQLRD